MLQRLSAPVSERTHQKVSLWLLGALIFLRIPFLATIATFWQAGSVFAYITFILFTYLITAFLIWWERDRLHAFWIDLVGAIFFLCQYFMFPAGIGLFAAMRRSKARFPAPPPGLLRWSLTGALLAILLSIFEIQFHLYPPQTRSDNPAALSFLFSAALIQLLNAAVWEEPLFRGFLWGHLRLAGWKNGWIWIFQALLFTFAHFYYLRTEAFPIYFARMMLPALLVGLMAWRARSIAASMVTHAFLNATGDLLMHTGTLSEALNIAWTGAVIIAVALVLAAVFEIIQRRRPHLAPQG